MDFWKDRAARNPLEQIKTSRGQLIHSNPIGTGQKEGHRKMIYENEVDSDGVSSIAKCH